MNTSSWFFKGLVALFALLLASCAKEETAAPQPIEPEGDSPHFVTYEKALEGMNELIQFIDGQDASRAAQPKRTIANHYTHSFGERSRAAEGSDVNTDVYVVNFEDEQGFAILGSDDRLPDVFALAESGSLDLSQPIENPGLEVFVTGLEDYMEMISNYYHWDHWVNIPEIPTLTTDFDVIGPWEVVEKVGDVIPAQWHRSVPFNNLCRTPTGQQAPAGCAAVAAALIMYYHGYPTFYNYPGQPTRYFDWSEIRKHIVKVDRYGADYPPAYDAIAELIQVLGNENNLKMDYGSSGSFAKFSAFPTTFHNFGYSSVKRDGFDLGSVVASLRALRPICIGAQTGTPSQESLAHAWVIDAFMRESRTIEHRKTVLLPDNSPETITIGITIEDQYLFHCNWGERGANNGYYYSGAFNFGAKPIYRDPLDINNAVVSTIDDYLFFRYVMNVLTDIHPYQMP